MGNTEIVEDGDSEITEDEENRALKDVQTLTDEHIKDVEKIVQNKEQELMTV